MGEQKDGDRSRAHGSPQDGTPDTLTEQRPTCFVIQPFDRERFDGRYRDTFKPALAQAGFEAYRVDEDPKTDVVIDRIETGIQQAQICLADVTLDNPNVWYELGFAKAARKPVILTCCKGEREGGLPFDILHRKVILYTSTSARDFDELKEKIIDRALVLFDEAIEKQIIDADPIAPQDGVPQIETKLLGWLAGETVAPGARESVWSVQMAAKSLGLTKIAIGLALRGLVRRGFVDMGEVEDDHWNVYEGASVTDEGWKWIEEHASLFNLTERIQEEQEIDDEDSIPF